MGGIIVRIIRPDNAAVLQATEMAHFSEQTLPEDDWDVLVVNNRSVKHLRSTAHSVAQQLQVIQQEE